MHHYRKIIAYLLSLVLMMTGFGSFGVSAESSAVILTFSDTGIVETVPGSGYAINGTSLVISSPGIYKLGGTCSEGTVEVAKGASDVILILDNLDLTSSVTAPVDIKKTAAVTIHLDGVNSLTNNENPENETSEDTAVADAFEGAAIKVKSNSSAVFCGEGTLNIYGNAKNGIKGGAETELVFNSGTYNVKALNNGIASDGSLVINGGMYAIESENDGIKSVPDVDDTLSKGIVTINGGSFTINAGGDGIQAESELCINNGTFNITTMSGYNDTLFNKDTMSCKGLKASGDRENIENALIVNGGVFDLNTADDALHSDYDITVTGGTFTIRSDDDGVHADGKLTLGTENGYDRDPDIMVANSYEGLEGGNVFIYSGRYYVNASDDGVNAAGGSDSSGGTDPWHPWNPGPGSGNTSDYNIYIYGGNVYVNCTGDGLDSNGGLYLYGGRQTVLSQGQGGDNSPLDSDGTIVLKGAEVFAAGTNPMNDNPSSGYQTYYRWSTRYNAGTVIRLSAGNELLYNEKLLRNINYMLYSKPDLSSQPSVAAGTEIDPCVSNDWSHAWNDGVIVKEATEAEAGLKEFSCADCQKTAYQTVPYTPVYDCGGHEDEIIEEDHGYAVKFIADEQAKIDVYYTQDYTEADETGVNETVSRNSDTGAPDSTGNGQVNFAVISEDGYEVDEISIEGGYKNLKKISSEGNVQIYRITKVTSELTVTVKMKEKVSAVSVYGHSLSLDGTIGVNFYLTVPDDLLETAVINTSVNGRHESIAAKDAEVRVVDGMERRVVSVKVYAKEMRDEMILSITDAEGNPLALLDTGSQAVTDGYSYSVAKYLETAKTSASTQELKDLAKDMDNYGKYAQIYFEYNVNEEVTNADDVSSVTADMLKEYEAKTEGSVTGIEYTGSSLELNSANCLRAYFKPEEAYAIDTFTFTLNGTETEAQQRSPSENVWYIVTDEIDAKSLNSMSEFVVTNGTEKEVISCGPLSYAYNALSRSSNEKLKDVCRALYLYHVSAKAYFE